MNNQLHITYKVYMEAEDITQSRIMSSSSYVKNLFLNCQNTYLNQAKVDDESDMDDFSLRLYVDQEITETECSNPKEAKTFVADFFEFVDAIAHSQSYMDMEGSVMFSYQGEVETYQFTSESDQDYIVMNEA